MWRKLAGLALIEAILGWWLFKSAPHPDPRGWHFYGPDWLGFVLIFGAYAALLVFILIPVVAAFLLARRVFRKKRRPNRTAAWLMLFLSGAVYLTTFFLGAGQLAAPFVIFLVSFAACGGVVLALAVLTRTWLLGDPRFIWASRGD